MMITTLARPSSPAAFLGNDEALAGNGLMRRLSSSSKKLNSVLTVACSSSSSSSSSRSYENIPKLKPFNRSLLERALKEPPLIQKAENEIADYCTMLEGDECYSCWRAYFELKELEEEAPKQDVERMIRDAGGMNSLIDWIHHASSSHKMMKEEPRVSNSMTLKKKEDEQTRRKRVLEHVPDGLPKSAEELEEEEKALMPDSPHTRLLRVMGKYPAWYTPAPDHETD